nr:hypothetical protein [uncultured Rhodoferax sp.]
MKHYDFAGQTACISKCALLVLLFGYSSVFANQDANLEGCWRSQHVEITRSDQRVVHMNGDCVIQYTATQARSVCETSAGRKELLSAYEINEPGQLRVTVLDQATGQPKVAPTTLRYRIEDEWLLLDRNQFPLSADSKSPIRLRSVSIRIPLIENGRCEPHGETGMRVGRTPRSSLSISAPSGWRPLLIDPSTDQRLGPAVNSNLFIGAFSPIDAADEGSETKQLILILDSTRPGPLPVRGEQFELVKRQFSRELKNNQITCDQSDRTCASLLQPNGSHAYTEFVNLKGRVAIVSGVFAQDVPNAVILLKRAVQDFVAKLRDENSN